MPFERTRTTLREMKPLLILAFILAMVGEALAEGRPEPQLQIDAFFRDLGEKGASAAVKELCEGTLLEKQQGVQLDAYPPQMETALKIYGKLSRVENVDKKLYGQSFVRFRLISYQTSGAPLFWEFVFFKRNDEWQVYTFRFHDQFARVFPEAP